MKVNYVDKGAERCVS